MDQLVSKQDQSQLEIGYLRKENSGLYVCKVTTELDSVTVVQTVRVVSTPPTIVNKSKVKVGALSGGDTTLNCVAEGIPEPEISWKFRGQVIEKGSSSLEFAKVSANDSAGTYTCLAVNEYGMDQHEILLEVYKPIKFVKGPLDLLSNSLEKSVFDCQVEIDDRLKDETAITWTMNDGETVPEEFIEAPDKLVISSTLKDNQGTFTCSVSNSYESNVNMTARLTVLGEVPSFISTEKDVRALEGSHVTVSCQANGLPMPKIKWLKDGSPVPVQKETGRVQQLRLGDLKISDVSLDDQGSYTCLADNVYGTIQTNTSVEVIKRAVPDLKKRVRDITKAMRDNVTLGCDISYDPRVHHETDFVWNKEGEQLMNLSNKYQIQNDSSLLIFDLSMEDRGVYECQVKTPFETISHKVSLQVSGEAPKILSDLRKETIYEGGDLTLKCLVRGVPTPTLKWLFRDKPILPPTMVKSVTTASVEFVESHVIVRKASKANEGVYQCETSNIYGSGVAKFAKVVVIKKTTVEIASSEDEKAMSVHAGQKLKIPCHVGNDPLNRITNIQWTKNGKPITIGAQDRIDFGMDGSITISDVQRRHEGDYKCNVTTVHDHGADSISLSVVVNAPFITSHSNDQVIFSGDSLSLKCKASGIPEPRISWRFNQTRTSVHKKEFQITNAIVSDAGNYTCTARNDYGETKKMIPVAIIAVPTILPEYHVKTGVKLTLPCVSTDKNVQSSWIKDGASVTESQDVTILESGYLEIKSANSDTPGVYSCVVESKQNAKRRKILQTMVKLKPNIIIVEGGSVAIPEEEDLQLECKVLQGIDTKRLWKYNDQFVIEGGSKDIKERGKILTIDNVKQEDSGTYSCIAITNFGQDTIEYKVIIVFFCHKLN